MPAPLNTIRGLIDPLKSYQYSIIVQPIPSIVGIDAQLLDLRCRATGLPGSSVGVAKVELAGQSVNYGTLREYEPWRTRVVEGLDVKILRGIKLWHDLIFNPTTGQGSNKAAYEATGVVQLLDNSNNVVLTRTLIGLFPQKIDEIDLNQERPGRAVEANITWVFDAFDDT